ncbi:hypothetical protein GQ55_5G354700 [Panicum hallii var. hallii]|uniref:Uncharacterized protein n=1 Tax=Panicum hallii var. hallii TaxID=1504633 RepID=A0A2T7DMB5_9POAL|nr:hypothetical protein GQ55_5G354700 [Panicum hallii var. hallii]
MGACGRTGMARRGRSGKKASGGGKMPSGIVRRGRRRGCWMGFFLEFFQILPSQMDFQMDLPRLLELLKRTAPKVLCGMATCTVDQDA